MKDFLKQTEDAQKFEFQILIEEYRSIRSEIQQRVSFHSQISTVGTAFIGGAIASIINMAKQGGWQANYVWLLLSISSVSSLLGLAIASNDEMLAKAAQYQEHELRPRLERLAKREVLLWHRFKHAPEVGTYNKILQALAFPFPHFLFITASGVPLVATLIIKRKHGFDQFNSIDWCCFVLSSILFLGAGSSMLLSARKYNDVIKVAPKTFLRPEDETDGNQKS